VSVPAAGITAMLLDICYVNNISLKLRKVSAFL
jgi:hypothetical protein